MDAVEQLLQAVKPSFVLGTLGYTELGQRYSWQYFFEQDFESDITLDTSYPAKESVSYAAWPLQAYIKGFSISNAVAVTFTHKADFPLENLVSPPDRDLNSPPLLESLGEVTLLITGGTVKANLIELDSKKHLFCIREAWEKEEYFAFLLFCSFVCFLFCCFIGFFF